MQGCSRHPTRLAMAAPARPKYARRVVLIGVSALLVTLPAAAHHSVAMFEPMKTVQLEGTVRQFQWTNPHCWIQLSVAGEKQRVEWSIQMNSPEALYRSGWRPGTLKAGDKITVVAHPTRDGTTGGLFVSAVGEGGRALGIRPR